MFMAERLAKEAKLVREQLLVSSVILLTTTFRDYTLISGTRKVLLLPSHQKEETITSHIRIVIFRPYYDTHRFQNDITILVVRTSWLLLSLILFYI